MDITDRRFVDDGHEEFIHPDFPHLKYGGDHDTVPVAVRGNVAAIDREIAELVYLLWSNGIETEDSCHDLYDFRRRVAERHGLDPAELGRTRSGQWAFISFATMDDIAAFMTIVAPEDGVPGSLWDRSTGGNEGVDHPGIWEWSFWPKMEGRRPKLGAAAEFPISDVPLLVPLLRQAASQIMKD